MTFCDQEKRSLQVISSSQQNEAIVLAPTWPNTNGGYGMAVRAGLLLYLECFSRIHFICISDQAFEESGEWESTKVEWTHIPISSSPLWVRFIRSLPHGLPAITIRYEAARSNVIRVLCEKICNGSKRPHLIFEDVPMTCFQPDIASRFPGLPKALRSHDMLIKAYGRLSRYGSLIHRLAWQYELSKIRTFEKANCEQVDRFWTISRKDSLEYLRELSVEADGVIGVCLDAKRYNDIPPGDERTVVSVGTADLRKGIGLLEFVQTTWPIVRAQIPDARLLLAGRGTERFENLDMGIRGMGYVNDDISIIRQGQIFINPQCMAAGVQLKTIVAMLAGRALVTTLDSIDGIEGKNNQHFIVAGSNKEMASSIVSLMTDHARARIIGKKGKEMAVNNYNIQRFIRITKHLIDDFAAIQS